MSRMERELVLGGLQLVGEDARLHESGCSFSVAGDSGVEFGSSAAVKQVAEAFWGDGSMVSRRRWDNATTSFLVSIEAPDFATLAAGEKALRQVLPDDAEKPVDLVWRPGFEAPAAVRTILLGDLEFQYDDWSEGSLERVFKVTLEHAPFVRSEYRTVVPAGATASTPPTVIYAGGDPTGFASSPAGQITSTSGQIVANGTASIRYTTPVVIGAHRWIRITGTLNTHPRIVLVIDGKAYTLRPSRAVAPLGWLYALPATSGTITSIQVSAIDTAQPFTVNGIWLRVVPPPTGKQGWREIEIGGTERTGGRLSVASRDGSTGLGTTIIHASPLGVDAYDPDLLSTLSSTHPSTTTGNPPGGAWYQFGTSLAVASVTSQRFATQFPRGSYLIVAWVRSPIAQTAALYAQGRLSQWFEGVDVAKATTSAPITFAANTPRLAFVGVTELPAFDAGSGFAQVTLWTNAASLEIGGWWAFPVGADTSMAIVETAYPNMWIESGTRAGPPKVRVGAGVNTFATGWAPRPEHIHVLAPGSVKPGRNLFYVVTTDVTDAAASLGYDKQWTYHPADDGSVP